MNVTHLFQAIGVTWQPAAAGVWHSVSPIDGAVLAPIAAHRCDQVPTIAAQAKEAFLQWRLVPAPQRGQLLYRFAARLRQHKAELARFITLECGKIVAEAEGEVQEMIDICDFAVGLSRQLHGLTIASERPHHALRELWQPLGPCLIISAFNFPMAVWSWNAALALVCGNSLIWKPSEKASLCAIACHELLIQEIQATKEAPAHLSQLVLGDRSVSETLVEQVSIPLVSATGSCRMGQQVGAKVAERFGRSILELGGNNAIIVTEQADLDLALHAILFGAVGTAGQRCTSTRRLFLQRKIADEMLTRLGQAYHRLNVGDPRQSETLVGPLIDGEAYADMQAAIATARAEGCRIVGGERRLQQEIPHAYYAAPALIDARGVWQNHAEEVFAPLLYCFDFDTLEDAIARQNNVAQGLSSAIFTRSIQEAEYFLSAAGSDCGIANVNLGTSGAEIGGAFGGEKHTGGGRESGSDAWKGYMRRMTATINYADDLPLAQGIDFQLN